MSDQNMTLIPLSQFRWLRYRSDPPEMWGRLMQAYRRPGSDEIIWQFVPIVYSDDPGEVDAPPPEEKERR